MTKRMITSSEFEESLSGKDKKFLASIKRARAQYKNGRVFDMTDVI